METPPSSNSTENKGLDELLAVIRRHWGFNSLRPLQAAAMRTVLDGRDSLLVLPTGRRPSFAATRPS
jgi:superfamily II DNA helicase RecQ